MKKDQKNKTTSLRVSSETLRLLSESQLVKAAGGISLGYTSCGVHICYLH